MLHQRTVGADRDAQMSGLVQVTERDRIETFLRRDLALHIYEVGDLDPFFWPFTTWYGLESARGELEALTLLYSGPDGLTLLALERGGKAPLEKLLGEIGSRLPGSFYAHLSGGLTRCFAPRWRPERAGHHLKMVLSDAQRLLGIETQDVQRLSSADQPEIEALYRAAYPGNWFDPRMLETEQYFGIRRNGELQCAAGVHVYSRQYRLAALGNIATLPSARRLGLARRATARLCQSLLADVDLIGLNVHSDNSAAIACYLGLGFDRVAPYEEVMFRS